MSLRVAAFGVAVMAFAALVVPASTAARGAAGFTIVNGTTVDWSDVTIRRAGSETWQSLPAQASAGAKRAVPFNDPDCAFDIRVKRGSGEPLTWAGVNLCDVKSVTLKSDPSTGQWVDYDAD